MKYKVGDKVKIKENLITGETYGGVYLYGDACRHIGEETMITKVIRDRYRLGVDNSSRIWTGEMLEPVDKMSAEEALKTYAEICLTYHFCDGCPIGDGDVKDPKECNTILSECTEDTLLRLKQWKADHEKKPIETEFVNAVRVIEDAGDTKRCVYEEEIRYEEDLEEAQVRVLKEYCEDRKGKFYAVAERICRVKE